jgi:hypothetical protein
MNDQDLERDLRTQVGPREQGYAPSRLPLTLKDAATSRSRSSRMPRVLMLAGAGVAGAVAVAVLAGAFAGHGPGVGSGSQSAAASAPTLGDCGASDVSMTAEPWGGAAGSRGTVVTVTLAAARTACLLSSTVHAQVVDANGTKVIDGVSPTDAGPFVRLDADASFEVGIDWSNWCDAQPSAPLTLSVGFGDRAASTAGTPGSIPGSAVPPCSGQAEPSTLSVTGLQPPSN